MFAIIVTICWHSCQCVALVADGIATFFVCCDRCYCHCGYWKPLGCYDGRCFLPMWLANLWDGWYCCHCGMWNSHIFGMTDVIVIVADGITTLRHKAWCCTVADGIATLCGWLMLLPLWQMELPHCEWADVIAIVADGIDTCEMADVNADCGRWNSHL